MDRVSSMQEQGSSHSVKFMEFSRAYSKSKSTLICLFEGQDGKFFTPRFNLYFGEERWYGIDSGGRRVVLELYNILSKHVVYKNSNYRCFIDRDFQDWFENPDPELIYITNGYSIENNYVSETAFKRILCNEFGITEFNDNAKDYNKCMEQFKTLLSDFNSIIHDFNCWIKAHRIMEYKNMAPKKLNVQRVKSSELFEVSLHKVIRIYSENPKELFKDYEDLQLDHESIHEAETSFASSNVCLTYRGKQQLEFFRCFLTQLRQDRTADKPSLFSKKGRVTLNLSRDNAISELSQYADVPACLMKFLSSCKATSGGLNGQESGHPQHFC